MLKLPKLSELEESDKVRFVDSEGRPVALILNESRAISYRRGPDEPRDVAYSKPLLYGYPISKSEAFEMSVRTGEKARIEEGMSAS